MLIVPAWAPVAVMALSELKKLSASSRILPPAPSAALALMRP